MNIYDPKVEHEQILYELTNPYITDTPEKVKNAITIHDDPYVAVQRTHAIIVCTEWDEFVVSITIYKDNLRILSFFNLYHRLSIINESIIQ